MPIRFFNYMMSLPFRFKENYNFFRDFLKEVSPESASIVNANWGFSLDDQKKLEILLRKQRFISRLVVSDLYKLIKKRPISKMRAGLAKRRLLDLLQKETDSEFGHNEKTVNNLIKWGMVVLGFWRIVR